MTKCKEIPEQKEKNRGIQKHTQMPFPNMMCNHGSEYNIVEVKCQTKSPTNKRGDIQDSTSIKVLT